MQKRFARFISVVLVALCLPAWATEVLVLNSAAVQVDAGADPSRKGFEIQNLGPNDIYCELRSSSPVLLKSHKVPASGGTWAIAAGRNNSVWCKAVSADQVTTAATIYIEVL